MLLLQAETIQVDRKKLLGNKELSEHSELPGQKTGGMVLWQTWICEWIDIIYLKKITAVFGGFSFMLFKQCRKAVTWITRGYDAQEDIQEVTYIVNL